MSLTVAPPSAINQGDLFALPPKGEFKSIASARAFSGNVVEKLVVRALGLQPIPIDGKYDVCFDAAAPLLDDDCGPWTYFECKSVRYNSKVPLYEWRRRKDEEAGVPLVYLICCHNTKGAKSHEEMTESMANTMREVLAVTPKEIDMLLKKENEKVCYVDGDCTSGYNRPGYNEGYRNLSVRAIRSLRYPISWAYHSTFRGHHSFFTLNVTREAKRLWQALQ